jgi:hypothetical protein
MTLLERIVNRINRSGDVNHAKTPRPLLSLEEFFEGNDSFGSIGYNFYPDQPSPTEFYEFFRLVRNKPSVAAVLVEISQHEVPEEWPSTDTIGSLQVSLPKMSLGGSATDFEPTIFLTAACRVIFANRIPCPVE